MADIQTATQQEPQTQAQGGNSANNTTSAQTNAGNTGIDYGKIQAMIDKGTSQKENAILKSYFEQQGMSEDEVKSAISDWKVKKQSQAQAQADNLNKLQASYDTLKARLTEELISKQAFNDCLDLGVERSTIPHVIKCADFADALDDKGNVRADKVREAIEKVLADVPAFKGSAKDDKGFKIGVGGEQNEVDQENTLRRAFGLAPKK